MWNVIVGTVYIVAITAVLMFLIFALIQKRKLTKTKIKEELALQGISAGIGARLHAVYPGSEWRWVCRPVDFVTNKGIARIEVRPSSNEKLLMDVCLNINCYMGLYVLNVVDLEELAVSVADIETDTALSDFDTLIDEEAFISAAAPISSPKPHDEETVNSWYNIVLIDKLTALIDDLHAKGEVCFFIGQDGRAYVEDGDNASIVCEFGEMPDISLWGFITEKLSAAGLFAEVQEENCIFISWA